MSVPFAGSGPVRVLEVESAAYRRAFDLFLAGSDEKDDIEARLIVLVEGLARRRVFLDVGAGDGRTTARLAPFFERTVAVEPSAAMREGLRRACPGATVVAAPVGRAEPGVRADLVLLSHVLYYLPEEEWPGTLDRVFDWVAPGGTLVVLLQDPDNACMRMVRHFTGARFDLRHATRLLLERQAGRVADRSLETVDNAYRTADPREALEIAEFMINVPVLKDLDPLPSRADLAAYVEKHFAQPDGTYAIGHAHDVVRIRRAPDPGP
ncbi:class I SAM-dependent methyltransferase [Streptomyces huiliensis]|uniref:class I SAM-dependent methyltransferase n=1 Tax=Streptomyces huiliensis TaxID=2876027 RepID=UPI001CBC78E2|nr:class I SAM-dependent methyltransferase [Streptomyces huiliensis]MBZ4318309.1 class I SAM-dependent methyltransferase [Streptomyces huiliensis]